jgi:hypothetical protein
MLNINDDDKYRLERIFVYIQFVDIFVRIMAVRGVFKYFKSKL